MEVPLEHPIREIKRLQRCINDLIGLLALPAIWTGSEPSQIVNTLLDTLLGMLRLDFVYARLQDSTGQGPMELVRLAQSQGLSARPTEICEALNQWFGDDPQKWSPLLRNTIGDADVSMVPLRLGMQAEIGVLIAGSRRADFPQQTESLLLNVTANQASIGLQEARLLSEQKRISIELDQRVAQRTHALAEAIEELRKEIADRKLTEDKLRRNEDALRQAHAQLARSEERWRSVFENSAIGVALTDLDGRFIATNPVYQKMLGYTQEELETLSFLDITHQEDIESDWRLIVELLEQKRQQFQIEKQYRRKDGSLVWVRNNVSLVPGTERVPRFLMALSEDITERKQAEEKLERSEAFLAEAQHLSRVGSFAWNVASGEITWSNEFCRIFEFDQTEPITLQRIGTRVHPDDTSLLHEMKDCARRGVTDFEYEHRLFMPDHSIKHIHLIAHGSRRSDGILEYIGAVQDVTQRRSSEEALAKARSDLAHVARVSSLGQLTASIAHEVNQPLSGIITNASTCLRMLGADPPNLEGARETARRTIRDGNRASEVITRLRALFSKKDATLEMVDLNEAVREVIALSLSELQGRRVVIQSELSDELLLVVGDRVQLQQVILNLIRNASDAMDNVHDRPRELVIRTERDEGNQARVSVKDVGVGLDPHASDRLFSSFYTTKTDGMGIGLSVSRSIVEHHRGRLWATPNDGPGTTFSFSVPCRAYGSQGANTPDEGHLSAEADVA